MKKAIATGYLLTLLASSTTYQSMEGMIDDMSNSILLDAQYSFFESEWEWPDQEDEEEKAIHLHEKLIKRAEHMLSIELLIDDAHRSIFNYEKAPAKFMSKIEAAAALSPCGCFSGLVGVLNQAADMGCSEVLKYLLSREDLNPNEASGSWTPLARATNNSRINCLRALLNDPRVDVNIQVPYFISYIDEERKATALMIAVDRGFVEGVRALLAHPKIDVSIKDSKNRNALSIANQKLALAQAEKKDVEKINRYSECVRLLSVTRTPL